MTMLRRGLALSSESKVDSTKLQRTRRSLALVMICHDHLCAFTPKLDSIPDVLHNIHDTHTHIYIHVLELLDISRYRDMFCASRLRTGSEVQLSNSAPRLSDEAKATTSVRKLLAVSYFLRLVSRTKNSGFSP